MTTITTLAGAVLKIKQKNMLFLSGMLGQEKEGSKKIPWGEGCVLFLLDYYITTSKFDVSVAALSNHTCKII